MFEYFCIVACWTLHGGDYYFNLGNWGINGHIAGEVRGEGENVHIKSYNKRRGVRAPVIFVQHRYAF